MSTLLVGCDDDNGSTTDEEAQTEDDDDSSGSSGTSTSRAGRSAGGSRATATAGRASGSGGRAAGNAGQGGRRSGSGADDGDDGDEGDERAAGGRTGIGGRTGTGGRNSPDAGAGGVGGTGGADDGDDAGAAIIELNDGQIAEITNVVNTGEISLGTLAVNRAVVPAAQDYAQSMVAMHTTAQERQTGLVSSLGLTPSPSTLSAELTEDAARTRATLESADALEFDLLYVQSQVDLHARVLLTIDEQLLPNVTAELLRADLLVTRAEVAAHLEQARAILATLDGSDTDAGVP